MAQFLRPDSDITATWSTSTGTSRFALIDEITPSDADYIFTPDQDNLDQELTLSNPAATPAAGTCTVRFRESQADGGVPASSGGSASSIECEVREGLTVVATSGAVTTTEGGWTTRSFTFNTSAVTDWTALEIHLLSTGSGGSPANRRGVAVSFVEVEVPDGAAVNYTLTADTVSFSSSFTAANVLYNRVLVAALLAVLWTGTAAWLNVSYNLTAEAGSYAVEGGTGGGTTITLGPIGSSTINFSSFDPDKKEFGMQIVPTATGDISEVTFTLNKIGSPDFDINIELWSESGGFPSALLGTIATINASSLTTVADETTVLSAENTVSVQSSTNYFILFNYTNEVTHDFSNDINWQFHDITHPSWFIKTSRSSSDGSWLSYSASRSFANFELDITSAGSGTNLIYTREVLAETTDYTLTGTAATLTYSGGVTNYDIIAESGSYALTGTDANLEYNRSLLSDSGTYAVSGQDASLRKNSSLIADSATYNFTGNQSNLEYSRILTTDSTTYVINGTVANIDYNRVITSETASYSVSGQDVATRKDSLQVAESETFLIAGQDVNIYLQSLITIDSGSYTLSGTDANLSYNQLNNISIFAESVTYSVSGTDAVFLISIVLNGDSSSYAVSLTDALINVITSTILTADSGNYTTSLTDASLVRDFRINADTTSYTVTGAAASLVKNYFTIADTTSYQVSGQSQELLFSRRILLDNASFSISGTDVNLLSLQSLTLTAEGGTYLVQQFDTVLSIGLALSLENGSFELLGNGVFFLHNRVLDASGESLVITFNDAGINVASENACKSQTFLTSHFSNRIHLQSKVYDDLLIKSYFFKRIHLQSKVYDDLLIKSYFFKRIHLNSEI